MALDRDNVSCKGLCEYHSQIAVQLEYPRNTGIRTVKVNRILVQTRRTKSMNKTFRVLSIWRMKGESNTHPSLIDSGENIHLQLA